MEIRYHRFNYSAFDSMDIAHEGSFVENAEIEVGDYILVHHRSKFTDARVLMRVDRKVVAYYFQGLPVFDYVTQWGSSYKCYLKHISKYDQIAN